MSKLSIDKTPTGEEEFQDWTNEDKVKGASWDPDKARVRIDKIARALAISWSIFLMIVVIMQGTTVNAWICGFIPVFKSFHLSSTEFIAVVTTTTATIFGFLIIISRHLFHNGGLKFPLSSLSTLDTPRSPS